MTNKKIVIVCVKIRNVVEPRIAGQLSILFYLSAKPILVDKVQKCITCGGPITSNPKRKGPKLIRCENCIAQDSVEQQRNNQSMC